MLEILTQGFSQGGSVLEGVADRLHDLILSIDICAINELSELVD